MPTHNLAGDHGDDFEKALAAFRSAPAAPIPIVPFSRGYAAILRGFDRSVISLEARYALIDVIPAAQAAAEPHIVRLYSFGSNLNHGVAALGGLLLAWASPFGSPERSLEALEYDRLNARIVANTLDSICAHIELAQGSATRPPAPVVDPGISAARH